MTYYIGKFFLWVLGWKVSGEFSTSEIKKCIFIVAPHTSFWDFFIGRLAFWTFKIDAKFLIKKEIFKGIVGPPLKALGGVPVDRNKGKNTIVQTVNFFKNNESFYLLITPEGTRKYTKNWKKGFYQIAQEAQVPICICYLNYKDKTGGIHSFFKMTGNFEDDFKQLETFYQAKWAKHPKQFNLNP